MHYRSRGAWVHRAEESLDRARLLIAGDHHGLKIGELGCNAEQRGAWLGAPVVADGDDRKQQFAKCGELETSDVGRRSLLT